MQNGRQPTPRRGKGPLKGAREVSLSPMRSRIEGQGLPAMAHWPRLHDGGACPLLPVMVAVPRL
jgi:hypothetical protein